MSFPGVNYFLDTTLREILLQIQRHYLFSKQSVQGDICNDVFFCLSTGRTGSTTLAGILSQSNKLMAIHEPKPYLYGMSCALYQNPEIADTIFAEQAFLTVRSEKLKIAKLAEKGFLETSPQATFLAPIIANALPNSKFIHIVRHPADVVRSGMRRRWYDGHSADQTRIIPREGTKESNVWGKWSAFEKNCWLWNETNKWIISFRETINDDRFYLIKAEDIYSGNHSELEGLYKFLTIPPISKYSVEKILSKKLNQQRTGDFPPYINWTFDKKVIIKNMVGEIAEKLGYQLDDK
jgi:hypothetical protein